MKIIHSADWHFNEKNHDEIAKCLDFMVNHSETVEPDLFLISGDITDSKNLSLDSRSARTIFKLINMMLDIAPVAIVIGTPSHDGNAALALNECRGNYPILVSDMPEQFGYYLHAKEWKKVGGEIAPEFIITQIPQPTKQYFINHGAIEDTDKAISDAMGILMVSFGNLPRGLEHLPHIVNGHGQIGGAFISETQQLIGRDIEVLKDQLKSMNADLICYGHIHKAQVMGNNIFYSGSPTRMNFGETEEKGFYVHELNNAMNAPIDQYEWSCESEFIKTPARDMISIKSDYTCNEEVMTIQEYVDSMEKMPKNLYACGCHVKFEIKVWQDEVDNLSQSKIETLFKNAGAERVKVLIIRVPRESVRAARVLESEVLADKIEAMAELRGESISISILEKAGKIENGDSEPWKLIG
jgi:DNA repair protein SbcD/Mre11